MNSAKTGLLLFIVFTFGIALHGLSADPERFEPELDAVWESSYGLIHWDKGWYGTETNTIEITRQRWDEAAGRYVISGNWGRTIGDSYKGTFEFKFTDPWTFNGWWRQDESPTKTAWLGKIHRIRPAAPAAPKPVGPRVAGKLKVVEKAPFVPDVSRIWKSSYGDIHWGEGYYGEEEKTITATEHGWDAGSKTYVIRGHWGRKSNPDYHGPFQFEFAGPDAFVGWWASSESGSWAGWNGSLMEK